MVKNPPGNAGEIGYVESDPWVRKIRSLGEGNGNPLQYSCLRNPVSTGDQRATVRRAVITT